MNKAKKITAIVLCLAAIVAGTVFTIISTANISDCIVFKASSYKSAEDVIFYESDLEADSKLLTDFSLIAEFLKENHPGKSILFLKDTDGASAFDAAALYRFVQITDNKKAEGTEMNVLISKDGSVEIQFLGKNNWKSSVSTESIRITQSRAEEIATDYLLENPKCYNELRNGLSYTADSVLCRFFGAEPEFCTAELTESETGAVWKIQFTTGNSYMTIDADTGEVTDTYFFSGVIAG